jgi:hypothetical protein
VSTGSELQTYGTSAKDFLRKSEKQLGAAGTAVVLGVGGVGLYLALPALLSFLDMAISAVGKTLTLLGLGVVLVFVLMVLMNPRTWTEIWHLQHKFTRKLSDALMKADPFGRMRAFANEYLQAQWEKFNSAATTIEEQLLQKGQKITKMEADLNEANQNVAALKSRHFKDGRWDSEEYQSTFRLTSQKIVFLENSLYKLRKDEVKLQLLVKIIDKWRNNFRFEIETTRMTADFLEEDFRQANATANALEAASSAFGGGDMALADREVRAYIEKLTAGRIARAEVLMKQIPELTAIGDLKGDVAEDEIMNRLRELDAEADRALIEVQENKLTLSSGDPERVALMVKEPTKDDGPQQKRRYLNE